MTSGSTAQPGRRFLAGHDPWQASIAVGGGDGAHFAALPVAAQLFAPIALLPADLGFALWASASVVLSVIVLPRLSLPIWWLLFPPLVEGLVAGNPQIVLLGLLVLGGVHHRRSAAPGRPANTRITGIARAVAAGLKVYAFVPMIARREWRAAGLAMVVLGFSVAAAPGLWQSYLAQFSDISGRLVAEAHGGTSAASLIAPGYGPGALAGLALFGAAIALLVAVAIRDTGGGRAGWRCCCSGRRPNITTRRSPCRSPAGSRC